MNLNNQIPLGILILGLALFSCGKKVEETSAKKDALEKTIPVKVAQVEEKMLAVPIHSIGKVFSQKESNLSFKTSGIIKTLHVNDGQKVSKGQVLASLDLSEIQGTLNKAQLAYEKAERDLKRVKNLYAEKVVTLETLENAQTAFDVAESDLKIVEFNFDYSVIKAPSSGIILNKLRESGELVTGGAPIFEFANSQQNWVINTGLVDKDVIKISLGDTATVVFDALPNDRFMANVTNIGSSPDPANGTYEVEISLQHYPNNIRKGFLAKVELTPSMKRNYKLIPIESLAEADNNNGVVYKLNDNRPKKVDVIVETILGDKALIIGDLTSNDWVISEGVDDVTDGQAIEIL